MAAVQFLDVKKNYKTVNALSGIRFDVEEGAFFGLLGPNGAGKSTLINTMAGLVRPTSGSIKIMGHDVIKEYRQTRRNIGLVPQELVSDGFFSIRRLLRLQAGYFGLGRSHYDWIEELLDVMALTDKADDLMASLSGGMKRRALIASALVHRPKIVVLDEPTAGVDVALRQHLWKFIRKLHSMGHTIILTTHYLEEAEQLCDRIAIINKGKLLKMENKADLIGNEKLEQVYLNLLSGTEAQE